MPEAVLRASAPPRETAVFSDLELLIDNFAGGGGASLGIRNALGREVDYAINHDEAAVIMHRENHPGTVHLCESVWKVDPREVVGKGRVGLAWFSPDCTHFSIARGAKPVSPRVRGLAWVVIKWCKLPEAQRPRVVILENVKEFVTWGPLVKKRDAQGRVQRDSQGRELEVPCPRRKGDTFKRWVRELRKLGYAVEWRELNAADYGAPTMRKRFFLIARRDGKPIIWPQPSHGDPKKIKAASRSLFNTEHAQDAELRPYRTAAECIDWSLPCPSIFLTREQARVVGKQLGMASLKRPLAENTMRRIANGLLRYVLRAKEPFIVGLGGRQGQSPERSVERPFQTITGKADSAVVVPLLARTAHGDVDKKGKKRGQGAHDINLPIGAVTGSGDFAVIAPTLTQFRQRDGRNAPMNEPVSTIVADGGRHAQVMAFLAKHFGGQVGTELPKPLPTTTQRGTQNQIVAATLARRCQLWSQCRTTEQCQKAGKCLENNEIEASHLVKLRGTNNAADVDAPAPTITGGGTHLAEVRAFLVKYYGTANGQSVNDPLHTVTAKERLGLVTIQGEDWQIVDIGMRMLTPRELARCQGFPDDYVLTGTKTNQVARIGNSVCPPVVEAMVRANLGAAR